MTKWPITVILLLAFAGGVFAGMPLHAPKPTMKCCDKAKAKARAGHASLARLRCALNCTETAPTSSGLSFGFSPTLAVSGPSVSVAFTRRSDDERYAAPVELARTTSAAALSFKPRYLRYHSFLI